MENQTAWMSYRDESLWLSYRDESLWLSYRDEAASEADFQLTLVPLSAQN